MTIKDISTNNLIRRGLGLLALGMILVGCGSSGGGTSTATINSHIDTSITPQQRIENIQNNPDMAPDAKAKMIAHIKANNHLN